MSSCYHENIKKVTLSPLGDAPSIKMNMYFVYVPFFTVFFLDEGFSKASCHCVIKRCHIVTSFSRIYNLNFRMRADQNDEDDNMMV